MTPGWKRWMEDRRGRSIYLTQERWEQHILGNRPEMEDLLDAVIDTVQTGNRRQEAEDPRRFRYYKRFDNLPFYHNHVVVVVLFRDSFRANGEWDPNNFVVTAWTTYFI